MGINLFARKNTLIFMAFAFLTESLTMNNIAMNKVEKPPPYKSQASTAHEDIKGTTKYLPSHKISLKTLLIELIYLPL